MTERDANTGEGDHSTRTRAELSSLVMVTRERVTTLRRVVRYARGTRRICAGSYAYTCRHALVQLRDNMGRCHIPTKLKWPHKAIVHLAAHFVALFDWPC